MEERTDPRIETWQQDIQTISRWFLVDITAKQGNSEVLLLRRILGWDNSAPPKWVRDIDRTNVRVVATELSEKPTWPSEAQEESAETVTLSGNEARRVELRIDTFLFDEPTVKHWGLRLPSIMYEIWCDEDTYEKARQAWLALTQDDLFFLRDGGFLPNHTPSVYDVGGAGYAGSTILHIPQSYPFFPDLHNLVLPGGPERWGRLKLVSMTTDGPAELGSGSCELTLQPTRELEVGERLNFLEIYCPDSRFSDLEDSHDEAISRDTTATPDFIAEIPQERIIGAPADTELMVIPEFGPPSRISWGLIKSVQFTMRMHDARQKRPYISHHMIRISHEPWIERVPQFGFSTPPDIYHIPPDNPRKSQQTFQEFARAGSTILLCDPYVSRNTLKQILSTGISCKLLTTQGSFNKLGDEWCRNNQVEVRIISDEEGGVHDRFLLGTREAYILGTSLTGIGNRHSFVVKANNKMRWVLRDVFEQIWNSSPSP